MNNIWNELNIRPCVNGWVVSSGLRDRGMMGQEWIAEDEIALGELVSCLARARSERLDTEQDDE